MSITQATEMGTVYTVDEVRALTDFAHAHGMTVHMDGSRLWNAAAALDVPLREFTTDAGIDIVSLGGTKNGLLGAEAVVVLNPERAVGLVYLRKLTMQLASKMRFASAQLLALFDGGLGIRSAGHANAMAARLRAALSAGIAEGTLPGGLAFTQETSANAVFATLPVAIADQIRERVRFYDWDRARGEVRWMAAWDTTAADVDHFVTVIEEEFARASR